MKDLPHAREVFFHSFILSFVRFIIEKTVLAVLFLVCGVGAGCSSATEKKGVALVARWSEGQVDYSSGTVAAATAQDSVVGKYAALVISGSKPMEIITPASLPASYCAYLFFRSLSPTEQADLAQVKVRVEGEKDTSAVAFRTEQLRLMEKANAQAEAIVAQIKTRSYASIYARTDSSAMPPTQIANLKKIFARADSSYGKAQSYVPYGFDVFSQKINGKPVELVKIFGQLKMEKIAGGFSMVVNPRTATTGRYIYGLGFYN